MHFLDCSQSRFKFDSSLKILHQTNFLKNKFELSLNGRDTTVGVKVRPDSILGKHPYITKGICVRRKIYILPKPLDRSYRGYRRNRSSDAWLSQETPVILAIKVDGQEDHTLGSCLGNLEKPCSNYEKVKNENRKGGDVTQW